MQTLFLTAVLSALGITVGFLAQRSRMCFVAGFRDYFLVRDRELLTGLFTFLVTLWLFTSILYPLNLLKTGIPEYGGGEVQAGIEQSRVSLFNVLRLKESISTGSSGIRGVAAYLSSSFLYVSFFGGLLIGIVATFSGGCVLRQHVLLAQGSGDALYFIAGFYGAVVFYYFFLFRFFVRIY